MSNPINASTYVMNVNMLEHQRNILAVLGVDLWMPKADVRARTFNHSFYRDQAVTETISTIQFESPITIQADPQALEKDQISIVAKQKKQQPQKPHPLVEVDSKVFDQTISSEARTVIQVEPFTLQAFKLEHCTIILNSTDLSVEQAKLWVNIQMAVSGQYHTLSWPFALTALQDGRGAQVYIQGFLDALSVDKQIVSLGRIPHYNESKIIQLASLQEMLDQPQLKRSLWQFMQK